jgi:molecular chaperone GrpE
VAAEEKDQTIDTEATEQQDQGAETPDGPQNGTTQENGESAGEPSPEEIIAARDQEIESLKQEISDLKDQYLRKQADMDNFRKRLMREKEDAIAFANRQLLEDLITIIDNFERAIQSSEAGKDYESFHDGIVMIEKEFVGMLERKWHLTRFESVGEEFDPSKHEAMMMEDSTEHDRQVVLQDFQKGYMLQDQVLRAAKVKVANPVGTAETGEDGADAAE